MRYRLSWGVQPLPIDGARVRLQGDGMDGGIVSVLLNGKDAGGFSGPVDQCEAWVAGWLSGRLSQRDPALAAEVERLRKLAGAMADHRFGDRWWRTLPHLIDGMHVREVKADGLLMSDGHWWDLEELAAAGWVRAPQKDKSNE